jgi:hypothetical protein
MTHQPRSLDFDAQQQRVAIAVRLHGHNSQSVSRTLPLSPELISRPAEKRHVSVFQGAIESLTVHKSQHQDLSTRRILHHRGKQPAQLFEIKFVIHRPLPISENKKPAERCRVSGPELLKIAVYLSLQSQVHPRRRAVRVMMMAVVEMRQHATPEPKGANSPGQSLLAVRSSDSLDGIHQKFALPSPRI